MKIALAKTAWRYRKPLIIGAVILIIVPIAAVLFFMNALVSGISSIFSFGGDEDRSGVYMEIADSEGVMWADVAAFDAARTQSKFQGVTEQTIRESTEKFFEFVEVCEDVPNPDYDPEDADENGDVLDDDGNVIPSTIESCKMEKRFLTLETVMQREGFGETEIQFALLMQQSLPEVFGGVTDDLIHVDPELIRNNAFMWPAPGVHVITSQYGMRVHPRSGERAFHFGVDIANGQIGSSVVATAAGTVYQIEDAGDEGCGKWIRLEHENGFYSRYCHLRDYNVERTDSNGEPTAVEKGQVIGYIGESGFVTGPHLHFEMKLNGRNVDPLPLIMKTRYGGAVP